MSGRFYAIASVIAGVVFGVAMMILFGGPGRVGAVFQDPTDLVVGLATQVADFRSCKLPDESLATEWHFGGADRSRRNQLTPQFDGRGRRIFRVVTNDPTLPAGHMRIRRVEEHAADPKLEGFDYGTFRYDWNGLRVEFNGPVQPQATIGPCGPAR